jgi:hypothetical protein
MENPNGLRTGRGDTWETQIGSQMHRRHMGNPMGSTSQGQHGKTCGLTNTLATYGNPKWAPQKRGDTCVNAKWVNKGSGDANKGRATHGKPNRLTKAEATHGKPKWAHKGRGDTWKTQSIIELQFLFRRCSGHQRCE